jgi:hypothetical protein
MDSMAPRRVATACSRSTRAASRLRSSTSAGLPGSPRSWSARVCFSRVARLRSSMPAISSVKLAAASRAAVGSAPRIAVPVKPGSGAGPGLPAQRCRLPSMPSA